MNRAETRLVMNEDAALDKQPYHRKLVNYSTRRADVAEDPTNRITDAERNTTPVATMGGKKIQRFNRQRMAPARSSSLPSKDVFKRSIYNVLPENDGSNSLLSFNLKTAQNSQRSGRRSSLSSETTDNVDAIQNLEPSSHKGRVKTQFVPATKDHAATSLKEDSLHKSVLSSVDNSHSSFAVLNNSSAFNDSFSTALSFGGSRHEERASSGTKTIMSPIKERRSKMMWLANMAPKRDLIESTTEGAPPPVLKIIRQLHRGEECRPSPRGPDLDEDLLLVEGDVQLNDPLDKTSNGAPKKPLSLEERRRHLFETYRTGQQEKSRGKITSEDDDDDNDDSSSCSSEGTDNGCFLSSEDETDENDEEAEKSLSLRTLSGHRGVVSSSRRRSSMSFVAGSRIRKYNVGP